MESLGQFLKHGREEAGVTLEELAQRTRIRLESLSSLEQEELNDLPTDPYVRGFVRQVCRELGLAPQEGLVRYETLRASSAPTDEITWAEERQVESTGRLEQVLRDPEQVLRTARWIGKAGLWGGAVAVLALVGWGGYQLIDGLGKSGPETIATRTESAPESGPPPALSDAAVARETSRETQGAAPPAPAEIEVAQTAEPTEVVVAPPTTDPEAPEPDPGPRAADVARRMTLSQVEVTRVEPDGIRPEKILVTVAPYDAAVAAAAREAREARRLDEQTIAAAEEVAEDLSKSSGAEDDGIPLAQTFPLDVDADVAVEASREEIPSETSFTPEPVRAAVDPVAASASPTSGTSPLTALGRAAPPRAVVVPRPSAGERLELTIHAIRPVQVTVLLDGIGFPRTRALAAGQRKAWKADSLFVVSADDGAAIRLELSGRSLGVPGTSGVPLDRLPVRAR